MFDGWGRSGEEPSGLRKGTKKNKQFYIGFYSGFLFQPMRGYSRASKIHK